MTAALFPFATFWWLYLAFTGLVVVLLWIDLALHRSDRAPSLRGALIWTVVWVFLALAFCRALYWFASAEY